MNTTHILVVDDDVNTLQSVEFILQAGKYEVSTAKNGKEALALLLAGENCGRHVDLLITDIQMPIMGGMALIDEVRRRKFSIPILVITAFGDRGLYDQLHSRGCNDYLDKPFDDLKLLQSLTNLLARR